MSKWFPDINDEAGVKEALKLGRLGTFGFMFSLLVGIGFLYFSDDPARAGLPVEDKVASIIGVSLEFLLVLWCAWRFHTGKGLFIGCFVVALHAAELANKLITMTTNIGWVVFHVAILVALINGVRGAWGARKAARDSVSVGP